MSQHHVTRFTAKVTNASDEFAAYEKHVDEMTAKGYKVVSMGVTIEAGSAFVTPPKTHFVTLFAKQAGLQG